MVSPVLDRAKAAGQAAGRMGNAGNDAEKLRKMEANREAANATSMVQAEKRFSLAGMFGTAFSVASMALFIPGGMKLVRGAIGLAGKLPMLGGVSKTAVELVDLHKVPVGEFKDAAKKVFAHNDKIAGMVETHSNKLVNYANNTIGKTKVGKSALENIKGVSTASFVTNVGFAFQQTASIGFTLKDKLNVLQQMQEDLTGKRPSKMAVLTGSSSLDPMVKRARGEAVGGKSFASMVMQLAGAAGNIYLGFFDKSQGKMAMVKALGIGAAPMLVDKFLTSSNTTLAAYKQMTFSIAQSGQASEEMYRNVAIGFVPAAKTGLVDKMAKIGAEQNLAPKEYLQLMSSMMNPQAAQEAKPVPGKFMQAEMARRAAANDSAMAIRA